eukprot:7765544-Pyramimonas_sp.AAC.1
MNGIASIGSGRVCKAQGQLAGVWGNKQSIPGYVCTKGSRHWQVGGQKAVVCHGPCRSSLQDCPSH